MKNNKSNNQDKYRTYQEAKAFVQGLGIKSVKKWQNYCKSGDKPKDIPSSVNTVYNDEWEGWKVFLGTSISIKEDISPIKTDPWEKWDQFLADRNILKSYQESKDFVKSLGIKTEEGWKEYCESDKKPDEIPTYPNKIYKNEWKGWDEFLGTGKVTFKATPKHTYRSYADAKEYAKSLNIKYKKEWNDLVISKKLPKDIPADPNNVYAKEWEGWSTFFGINERLDEFYRKTKEYIDKKFGK